MLEESLKRVQTLVGKEVGGVGADRGFASKANSEALKKANIFDGICPRDPKEMGMRMKEEKCAQMQKRRSQTKGGSES